MPTKCCTDCGLYKPIHDFGYNASQSDGRSFYCMDCNRRRSNEHYRKARAAVGKSVREADESPAGSKRCAGCGDVKVHAEFHAHSVNSTGLNSYCKACRKVQNRKLHLKRTYGLDEDTLQAMVDAQGGLCAVCKKRPAVHVDHDHALGTVRGVLCFTCNVALGHLEDDPQLFLNAIDYLERTTWQRTLVSTGVYRLTSPRPAAARSATSSGSQRPTSSHPD